MLKSLERYFEFTRLGTNWRTEILAGVTTFLTMAYIVLVNPAILSAAGVPLAAVTAATCLSAGFGSILMGVVARYPIALAPGMGLNAYFTYTVCLKMHVPWQTALGAVFISGVLFLAFTAAGVRQMILRSIPHELYAAVASGIGLFIAFIGFRNAGLVVSDPATFVGMGNVRNPTTALALFGLILMVALEINKVRGSILIGVLFTTGIAWAFGLVHWTNQGGGLPALTQTALQLDVRGALNKGLLEIVFVFFFVDLFDNLGTLVAVTKRAGLIAPDHSIPRLNRILFADAASTIFGSLTGTSTVTSYVESTAGVAAGGRSGVTAIVTGLLFLLAMGAAPFAGIVPHAATAPALILVGSMMLATITEIRWHEPLVAMPAFLTLVLIPLTYSIANGLG
ncbi:MAG TPA: NCS2 family permease, partial [Terracidiphilus sp.]|nr:NCS2 family permease [Terracidiphilus sp.]